MSLRNSLQSAATPAADLWPQAAIPAAYDPSADKSGFMNPTMLAYFYELLRKKRKSLEDEISQINTTFKQTGRLPDPADRALHDMELHIAGSRGDSLRKNRNKVIQAIHRIESTPEEYGYDEITGEPIDLERLLAVPEATLSREEKDKKHRQQGTRFLKKHAL